MEVDASSHTVSLLASLNLQREQTHFCDCVIKLRHDPGPLHAAHRCVLAASSPVLSSIVSSSTCALVELEAPCLSDSVLTFILDYVYTGIIPHSQNLHQRSDLLRAASYLQMDDLQESLRTAENLDVSSGNASKHLENYPDDVDTCSEIAARRCSRKYSRTLRDVSVNTRNYSQETHQGLIQGFPGMAEESGVDYEDELEKTVEDETKRFPVELQEETQTNRKEEDETPLPLLHRPNYNLMTSSSSSSPHPCVGAVPVIRHSKTMSPISQNLSSTSSSQTGSTDGIVGNVHLKELNQHYRNDKDLVGSNSWEYRASPNQCDDRKPDNLMEQDDGLSNISEDKVHQDLQDSSVQRNKDLCRKSDVGLNEFTSKRQRLDCSDCHDVWINSQDSRTVVTTSGQEVHSDTGSEDGRANCWVGGPNVKDETKRRNEGISFPRPGPRVIHKVGLIGASSNTKDTGNRVTTSGQEVHSDTGSEDRRAKQEHSYSRCLDEPGRRNCTFNGPDYYPNTHNTDSIQHGYNSDNSSPAVPEPNLDSSGLSDIEHGNMLGITMNLDTCEPTNSLLGSWYRGHIQYHSLPQEEVHQSQGHHAVAGPGFSPTGTPDQDQVLLLDISAKPAELLIANAVSQKAGQQWVDETAEDTNCWVGETNVKDEPMRRNEGISFPRPGPWVIHKVGLIGTSSNTKDSGKRATTLQECSPRSEPDSVSSVLSVVKASAKTPMNFSARLSDSVGRPFECSLCDRSFSQRGSLNRHVRSHLGVRPFPCPRCPMTFSRQYRVTEHMRVHQRCDLRSDLQKPPASSI